MKRRSGFSRTLKRSTRRTQRKRVKKRRKTIRKLSRKVSRKTKRRFSRRKVGGGDIEQISQSLLGDLGNTSIKYFEIIWSCRICKTKFAIEHPLPRSIICPVCTKESQRGTWEGDPPSAHPVDLINGGFPSGPPYTISMKNPIYRHESRTSPPCLCKKWSSTGPDIDRGIKRSMVYAEGDIGIADARLLCGRRLGPHDVGGVLKCSKCHTYIYFKDIIPAPYLLRIPKKRERRERDPIRYASTLETLRGVQYEVLPRSNQILVHQSGVRIISDAEQPRERRVQLLHANSLWNIFKRLSVCRVAEHYDIPSEVCEIIVSHIRKSHVSINTVREYLNFRTVQRDKHLFSAYKKLSFCRVAIHYNLPFDVCERIISGPLFGMIHLHIICCNSMRVNPPLLTTRYVGLRRSHPLDADAPRPDRGDIEKEIERSRTDVRFFSLAYSEFTTLLEIQKHINDLHLHGFVNLIPTHLLRLERPHQNRSTGERLLPDTIGSLDVAQRETLKGLDMKNGDGIIFKGRI